MVHLRALGFCGADDSVSPEILDAISAKYPWIEWGVLFREEKQGEPRFASAAWLQRLKRVNAGRQMRLAGHLCSSDCEAVLRGDASTVAYLHRELGFGRFQINATAANNVDMSLVCNKGAANVAKVMAAVPTAEFIIQRNDETQPIWEVLERNPPPNMSFLFDESKGLGKAPSSWPDPPADGTPFGYAGGLGPATVEAQLRKMATKLHALDASPGGGAAAAAASSSSSSSSSSRGSMSPSVLWIDMESRIRTDMSGGGDIFDLNKCMECVLAVLKLEAEGLLAPPAMAMRARL
jgi:hypothetical protein